MKILFVVPYTPNPIRVRSYELLRTLVRRGHMVTLATLWQNEQERQALSTLSTLGVEIVAEPLSRGRLLWNCVRALPGRAPIQAAYCWQPHFAQQLCQIVVQRPFDVIHVEHLRGARYALNLKQWLATSPTTPAATPPIIWDSVDCISHLFAQAAERSRSRSGRFMTRLELARTRRYEAWLLNQFEQVIVTSPSDRQALLALTEQGLSATPDHDNGHSQQAMMEQIAVLPNGVELGEFPLDRVEKSEKTVIFSGKMSYHANVTAALHLVQEIMPRVWAEDPAVQVQLVGKDPPAQIRSLSTVDTLANRSMHSGGVVVTGAVPEMRPYLSQATLAVAPVLYGAGIQNKVLEAMACGTPVIASPQAASGLRAEPGRDLVIAHTAADFAASILTLLKHPTQCAQIGQAGRAYVEQAHAWDTIGAQLESLYCNVIHRSSR